MNTQLWKFPPEGLKYWISVGVGEAEDGACLCNGIHPTGTDCGVVLFKLEGAPGDLRSPPVKLVQPLGDNSRPQFSCLQSLGSPLFSKRWEKQKGAQYSY